MNKKSKDHYIDEFATILQGIATQNESKPTVIIVSRPQ